MTTLIDANVGKLFAPELSRTHFLPGRTTAPRPGYMALVTYAVRDGHTHRKTQAAFAAGVVTFEGLREKWLRNEALQREFARPEDLLATLHRKLVQACVTHNERTLNGARMVSKSFWGNTEGSLSNATVNAPTRIALANANITATYTDQSLGTITANVTTNEATTNGMSRTGALTPSARTEPTSFDAQDSQTISNTFTDATGASTIYAAALVDNTSGAFNQFAEATFTSATLQIADTLSCTWTTKY